MIKGIFFDIGGTICSSSDNINKKPSFKEVLANLTHKSKADFGVKKQNYLWTSSISKKKSIIELCRDLKINNWEVVYKKLLAYSYKVKLYKDVRPCLRRLNNKYKLGLLANTTIWTAFDHRQLGLENYIKISILSCKIGAAKPDTKIFYYAQKAIKLKSHELLYIGDSIEYDIKPALAANWKAILLNRDKNIKNSPVLVISNLFELENILSKFKS